MAVNLGSAYGGISIDASGVVQGVAAAKSALQSVQSTFTSVGAELAMAGLKMTAAITLPILKIGQDALNMASDYETAMSRVAGLTDTSAAEVAKMNQQVLEMSKSVPQGAKELADGLFFVVSAGFKGDQAMQILNASARAAAAGLGETKTVADAVTSTLNAYKLGADQAAHVTDILTNAVVQGKMPPEELASALGRVLPLAAAAGVSFEQLAASIATMTRTGLSADEAATALRGVLADLEKPGKQAQDTLKLMGTSADELKQQIRDKGLLVALTDLMGKADQMAGKTVSMTTATKADTLAMEQHQNSIIKTQEAIDKLNRDIADEARSIQIAGDQHYWSAGVMAQHQKKLEDMKTALGDENRQLQYEQDALKKSSGGMVTQNTTMGDSIEIMGQVIPNIRALTGVLSTAGSQSQQYAAILDSMNSASGRTDKAFQVATQNFDFQVKVFQNQLGALAIQVGGEILPQITPLIKALGEELPKAFAQVRAAWESLSPQVKAAAVAFGAVLLIAGPIVLALGGVVTLLGVLIGPIGLVVLAVAALAAAWASDFGGIQEKTRDAINFIVPLIQNGLALIQQFWAEHGNRIISFVQGLFTTLQGIFQAALAFLQPIVAGALAGMQAWWSAHGQNVMIIINALIKTAQEQISLWLTQLQLLISTVLTFVSKLWNDHAATVLLILTTMWAMLTDIFNIAVALITGIIDFFAAALEGNTQGMADALNTMIDTMWTNLVNLFTTGATTAAQIVANLAITIGGMAKQFFAEAGKVGGAIIDGMRSIMEQKMEQLIQWVINQMRAMLSAAKAAIGMSSPSKEFMKVGESISDGLAEGIKNRLGAAVDTSRRAMQALMNAQTAVAMPIGAGSAGNSTNYSSTTSMGDVSAVFHVYDQGSMQLALAWVDQQRTSRLNATMGG